MEGHITFTFFIPFVVRTTCLKELRAVYFFK